MKSTLQIIQACSEKVKILEGMIPVQQYQVRLAEIDAMVEVSDFWNDSRNAAVLMKERQKISDLLIKFLAFKKGAEFNLEFADTCPDEIESLSVEANQLYESLSQLEFQQMMQDPVDNTPAILTISAGAGGLEAANWVTMLLRMYSRYADSYKLNVELLDMKSSEDHSSICTDSVSIRLEGPYAYGFLKGEGGVHRLIRNSPFNAGDARHTSFAAVSVTPDIEDTIDIKINENDLEITAQTSGGPGGQNSNKVCSAIRLRHLPTGINIFVRTERDQLSNKKTALKMLKAKLYEIEIKKRQTEKDRQVAELSNVSFGHQIRTYTETPYSLVVDHRTDCKINNFAKVLDGDIHEFLLASLRQCVTH
jgi:peptide chain release factor 2